MGQNRKEIIPEVRRWMGNLLVAWTFVTGLALVFASAWYYRTGDLKIIIAYLGAPFIIGTALFLSLGMMALASRTRGHDPISADGIRANKQRKSIYGPQTPPYEHMVEPEVAKVAKPYGRDGPIVEQDLWKVK